MTTTEKTTRAKPARKKVYERLNKSEIPQYVIDHFMKDEYELRWVRWLANGVEDFRNLSNRENEGYEFVLASELPDEYLRSIRIMDTKHRQGIITNDDLCLMKVDKDLRQSRRDTFDGIAQTQINAVDINVMEKKGFKNLGTKSKVMMKEPTFRQE